MKIALAQMNSILGDFPKNADKILSLAQEALDKEADLIVFPELALFGYHPFDLLERSTVFEAQQLALKSLIEKLPPEINCLFGAITKNTGKGKPYFNSALHVFKGEIKSTLHKELLPVYDVFDDSRHFSSGNLKDNQISINGKNIQVLICEDMWGWDPLHQKNPLTELDPEKIDLIVNLSASPFTLDKRHQRLSYANKTSQQLKAPLVYVNMMGAQDELIYDGGSFCISADGKTLLQSSYFNEELNIVNTESSEQCLRVTPTDDIEFLHKALVQGTRDFIQKVGFKKAHIGLSGGIDSALVACLIADAIGPQNLTCIALPTNFNSNESMTLAKSLTENLGCAFRVLPIQGAFEKMVSLYEECFGKREFSLMHENIQSRIRGDFLMAYSNDNGSMLITTGNKSEYATGYATLYGDMCGGLAPIADLTKKQVYDLSNYYNKEKEIIPDRIITREPSAELKENQKDSDSLPHYDLLDQSVDKLVCQKADAESDVDQWVLKKLYQSEFKRWQAPPILKVSEHAFGRGRRMPVAHKAKD